MDFNRAGEVDAGEVGGFDDDGQGRQVGPRADHIRAVITAHLTALPDLITATRDDTTGWADDFYQEES